MASIQSPEVFHKRDAECGWILKGMPKRLYSTLKNIQHLENSFSTEFKELISKSRDVAIGLGYDYISTLHFFLADCEIKRPNSIYYFAFDNDKEYQQFKTFCAQHSDTIADLTQSSIPLTKEAEKTIWTAIDEQQSRKQLYIFPCHLFIAAIKNDKSLFYECFKHNPDILAALTQYYTELGELNKAEAHDTRSAGFLASLANLFKSS